MAAADRLRFGPPFSVASPGPLSLSSFPSPQRYHHLHGAHVPMPLPGAWPHFDNRDGIRDRRRRRTHGPVATRTGEGSIKERGLYSAAFVVTYKEASIQNHLDISCAGAVTDHPSSLNCYTFHTPVRDRPFWLAFWDDYDI